MATKKKPTTKKSKSKKSTARRTKKAVPLPDNPLLRHEELDLDRRIEGDDTFVESPSLMAAMRPMPGARPRLSSKGSKAKAAESTVERLCKLRLAALQKSRSISGHDIEAPVMAARPSMAAMETGGADMVAPVTGISNWVQMGPTAIPKGQTYTTARVMVTGRITSIVVDPLNTNTIYVGAAQGGVWKTTDGGVNWVAKSDNEVSLAIGALAMDPSNHLVLYAGTGEGNFSGGSYYGNGILKTTDGGNTWTTLAQSTFAGKRFCRLVVTPGTPARLFAATTDGLYRSTNSGVNWTKLAGIPTFNATDVCIDPANPATVYAAFWGDGVYKTTNAAAATPTWTKLAGGLPTANFSRIALGMSPSSPQTIYALMSGPPNAYLIDKFLRTTDGGTTWTSIPLPGTGDIGKQGFYNIHVEVDPTTPDIVFLCSISVWKAVRSSSGTWSITNVGGPIHPDNHVLKFDPNNHLVIYAGNDGGIYKSSDAGANWSDVINEGLCITQFEFIDHHPTSDAVLIGGTQDNGTEQFRNSPVFYHSDDGDGGSCAIDRFQPNNNISTYYLASPKRSTQGGKFGTWLNVSAGLQGNALFYPPLALDDSNPNNIAFGTDQINLDAAQGTGGWPTHVLLPGIIGNVSAIHYVNSNLIYAGTTAGKVYRLVKSGVTWTATAINAFPLPGQWIWDIAARPDDPNTIIVVMSGFNISHVWRGAVPAGGGVATWTNISGTGAGTTLPNIPVNALAIDPAAPDTYYIATDVAAFRTTNGGTTWTQFSQGLPNCAVFDLRLHHPSRLLRAGTHGRGMWERKLDVGALPDADIFFRDNLMHTGRAPSLSTGVTAAFEDPLQYVALGSTLWWWHCADIKVDALEGTSPSYQMPVSSVDYVAFESKLQHRDAQRGKVNRVYVQVHNRGFAPGASVVVKLLYANASAGLPPLPSDFWTAFPNNSAVASNWTPIGTAQIVNALSPTEPSILEWDWSTPQTAADHTCLLVVMDSPSDPIPAASKGLDVNVLVRNEKRVGLKNLHVVDAPVASPGVGRMLEFHTASTKAQTIRFTPSTLGGWTLGLVLPKKAADNITFNGFTSKKPSSALVKALKDRFGSAELDKYNKDRIHLLTSDATGGHLSGVKIAKAGLRVILVVIPPTTATSREAMFNVMQEEDGRVVGGNSFVLRTIKPLT